MLNECEAPSRGELIAFRTDVSYGNIAVTALP